MAPAAVRDAALRGDLATITAYLDGGGDVNAEFSYTTKFDRPSSSRLLEVAVEGNHEAMVALLLARGARVDLPTEYRSTILSAACSRGAGIGILRRLIDAGADVNWKDTDGTTALLEVRSVRHPYKDPDEEMAVVKLLLSKGADVHAVCSDGHTALFHCQRPEMVSLIAGLGVDINAQDKFGTTALGYLVYYDRDNLDVARALLEHGADPNIHDRLSVRPLHYAAYRRRGELSAMLIAFGADVTGPLPSYCLTGSADLPTLLGQVVVGKPLYGFIRGPRPKATPAGVLEWFATSPRAAEIWPQPLNDRASKAREFLVHHYFERQRRLKEEREAADERLAKEAAEQGVERKD